MCYRLVFFMRCEWVGCCCFDLVVIDFVLNDIVLSCLTPFEVSLGKATPQPDSTSGVRSTICKARMVCALLSIVSLNLLLNVLFQMLLLCRGEFDNSGKEVSCCADCGTRSLRLEFRCYFICVCVCS